MLGAFTFKNNLYNWGIYNRNNGMSSSLFQGPNDVLLALKNDERYKHFKNLYISDFFLVVQMLEANIQIRQTLFLYKDTWTTIWFVVLIVHAN